MLKVQTFPRTCGDIGEILSTKHAEEKSENRDCLKRFCQVFGFLRDKDYLFAVTRVTGTIFRFLSFAVKMIRV